MDEVFKQPKWNEASALAQNFVLALLVLDEKRRLSAKEALGHCWFTNPEYKWRLYHDYQKAIDDWRPQTVGSASSLGSVVRKRRKENPAPKNGSFIRGRLGSGDSPIVSCHTKRWLSADEKKPKFPLRKDTYSSLQDSIPLEASIWSENSSGRFREAGDTQTRVVSSTVYSQVKSTSVDNNLRRPFSPHAWSALMGKSTSSDPRKWKKDQSVGIKGAVMRVKQGEASGLAVLQEPNDHSDASTTEPLLICTTGAKRDISSALASWSGESQEGGEVYEVVENKVTGKIQRILYGEKRRL